VIHKSNNHGSGNHHLMTGAPTPVPVNCGAHVSFHPSFGSVVAKERSGQASEFPPYMTLGRQSRSGGPNFLGAEHAPFLIANDPNKSSFKVRDVVLPKGISESRGEQRRLLRRDLDLMRRFADRAAADPAVDFDRCRPRSTSTRRTANSGAATDAAHWVSGCCSRAVWSRWACPS